MSLIRKISKQVFVAELGHIHSLRKIKIGYTRQIVYGALLASLATILQAAGIFGGIGFLISAMSTLPIIFSTVISIRMGFLTYLVACVMIGIIQPSELFSFPFTTGLLGFCMGAMFCYCKKGYPIALFSGMALSLGIFSILYIIQFPILGPGVSSSFDTSIVIFVLFFSILYSWVWMKLFSSFVKFISRFHWFST